MPIVTASGNMLFDDKGKAWLDLQSGILNTPLGHGSDQLHYALNSLMNSGLINTYDRTSAANEQLLAAMTIYEPRFVWKMFNTGAEAVEKALQIASTHFDRPIRIAVLPNTFHGKLMSMAWANYGDKVPWGNPLNLIRIDMTTLEDIPPFDALIYEPMQGWDGTVNNEALLRELCDLNGALLIADEMITSFLRCGDRFMNKTADITICGKGISGGAPLSFVGYRKEILPQGEIAVGWRSTGAGNNLSATIGLAMLRHFVHNEHKIMQRVSAIETILQGMSFNALGAFGFRKMRRPDAAKALFESERVIGSWHCSPLLRVGPSFVTTNDQLDILADLIEKAEKL